MKTYLHFSTEGEVTEIKTKDKNEEGKLDSITEIVPFKEGVFIATDKARNKSPEKKRNDIIF